MLSVSASVPENFQAAHTGTHETIIGIMYMYLERF